MEIIAATSTGTAVAVWNNATRTLTSFGAGAVGSTAIVHATLANGTSVDLRPAAGVFVDAVIIGEALANVTWNVALYDGTTFRQGPSGASGAAIVQTIKGSHTFGPALTNTGTVPGSYNYSGILYAQ